MHAQASRLPLLLALLLALGTGCSKASDAGTAEIPTGPVTGQTDFVSADAVAGQQAGSAESGDFENGGNLTGALAPSDSGARASSQPREVTEGDIYRVLDSGTIVNLNAYRGLQVLDVSNPEAPAIVGRLSLVGTPVEMYVRGDRALVLLNDWQGYYGSREDVAVTRREGGLLVAVDLSDRSAPRELDRELIEGQVLTSRVVANDAVAALYVASSHWAYEDGESLTKTFVTSFDVAGEALVRKTELDLGGYVQDIQATPDALLVASTDYTGFENVSSVAIVDISDPSGDMVLGDQVKTTGYVQSQFNMDLYNGVLRVVSTNWNGNNQVQTFDASDIHALSPLDTCSFGHGQQLYATLFLENKAFFVTYLRQDPFHAFEIRDDGTCIEHNEFIVSGWNDFFRPVAGGTRLIGVGTDDADSTRTPAVSLYDITSLSRENPLLARANAGAFEWSWSEASSDHRAFSVLEDVVSVQAADGTEETGLVLLPYAGWVRSTSDDDDGERYDVGVTLFTFSDRTVTRRGNVAHDSDVRRSFLASDSVAANLSETSLTLFDHTSPNQPRELGHLDLAPDYGRILRFGDYVARVQRPSYDYSAYDDGQTALAEVQIVPASADLNTADAVASFTVPAGAQLLKAGDLLVSVLQVYSATGTESEWYTTTVSVHDLTDPSAPRAGGSVSTDELMPTYFGYGYGYDVGFWGGGRGFIGCGMGMGWFDGSQADGVFALGDTLVFADARGESESIGTVHQCSYYAPWQPACDDGTCERLEGSIECESLNDGPEVCTERLARCTIEDFSFTTCDEVDADDVRDELVESCWTGPRERYWSRYAFKPLDLSDPQNPRFGQMLKMPRTQEGVSVLPAGESLYYTYRVPSDAGDDGRPLVRYYFHELRFDGANAPSVGASVNVPGELLAVDGDRVYTKDLRWTNSVAETFVHELIVRDDLAYLQNSRHFADREVDRIVVDGDTVLAVHAPTYAAGYWYTVPEDEAETKHRSKLSVLSREGLSLLGETDLDDYASLEAVHQERALFTVPGGLLMVNVENPATPTPQAFFYSNGWPEQILFDAGEIVIAAGRYGIHRFDADENNLLSD